VINWSLRRGLGVLVQAVTKPWITIIDHPIDIGTKKAIVAQGGGRSGCFITTRGSAIRQEDYERLSLTVSNKVTGDIICLELAEIFNCTDKPVATIDGIGYTIVTALKAQFEKLVFISDSLHSSVTVLNVCIEQNLPFSCLHCA